MASETDSRVEDSAVQYLEDGNQHQDQVLIRNTNDEDQNPEQEIHYIFKIMRHRITKVIIVALAIYPQGIGGQTEISAFIKRVWGYETGIALEGLLIFACWVPKSAMLYDAFEFSFKDFGEYIIEPDPAKKFLDQKAPYMNYAYLPMRMPIDITRFVFNKLWFEYDDNNYSKKITWKIYHFLSRSGIQATTAMFTTSTFYYLPDSYPLILKIIFSMLSMLLNGGTYNYFKTQADKLIIEVLQSIKKPGFEMLDKWCYKRYFMDHFENIATTSDYKFPSENILGSYKQKTVIAEKILKGIIISLCMLGLANMPLFTTMITQQVCKIPGPSGKVLTFFVGFLQAPGAVIECFIGDQSNNTSSPTLLDPFTRDNSSFFPYMLKIMMMLLTFTFGVGYLCLGCILPNKTIAEMHKQLKNKNKNEDKSKPLKLLLKAVDLIFLSTIQLSILVGAGPNGEVQGDTLNFPHDKPREWDFSNNYLATILFALSFIAPVFIEESSMIRISREQIKALSNCTTKMRKTKESSADLEGESKLALIEATSTTQMWKTLSKVEEIYNQHMPTSKPMIAGVV